MFFGNLYTMMILLFFISISALIFDPVLTDDVLGCNGFVKSDLNIDLSKVFVKLFTKQGSLKDQTECAPTNGYYFLPLYDKGDYIIKVSTPAGWSFEPSEVAISVDGVNDPCSQGKDINFVFNGFAISGRVFSLGHDIGPAGVSLNLYDTSKPSGDPLKSLLSEKGGFFLFTHIKPGKYMIKASHPKWQLMGAETLVAVEDSNGIVKDGTLMVVGYDVSGSVTSENQPISGVSFVLFTGATNKVKDGGCLAGAPSGFRLPPNLPPQLVCHVTSDTRGLFSFTSLPPASYSLVPHYKGAAAKFNIVPTKLDFTVQHSSLLLPTVFQVQGFSVSGKVAWSETGAPFSGVKVFHEGALVAETDSKGIYTLDNFKAAKYRLQFKADGVLFNDVEVKVSGTQLPLVTPNRFRLSGKLSEQGGSKPRKVTVKGSQSLELTLAVDAEGQYSAYLPKGEYTVSVEPLSDDADNSLQFSPRERKIAVKDEIITGIDFSQLQSTVTGKIVCMEPCPGVVVKLKPKGSGNVLETVSKGGVYSLTGVLPGDYDMFVEGERGWCWVPESHPLSVVSETTKGPTFVHSGYTLSIVSSHSTKVIYKADNEKGGKGEVVVGIGGTQACVPSKGPFTLKPDGCHGYKETQFRWAVGDPPVRLLALSHSYTFALLTPSVPSDLAITASSDDPSLPTVKLEPIGKKVSGGQTVVSYSVLLREGESLQLQPSSSVLLFSPLTARITGESDCSDTSSQPLFTAEHGHILKGIVLSRKNASLAGVSVTITDHQGSLISSVETGPDGSYSSPPIKKIPGYKVKAEKEGYILTGPDSKGDFSAHKLAEVIVSVNNKADGSPLQGVLLSLSGGKNYRRNAQTSESGELSFLSLSPGEYFLRPMMKEFKFTPPSLTITVSEGATQRINLSGVRVAYSGFGAVNSLNGEGEPGITVEAVGTGSCNLLQEESITSPDGQFRIRGLQSGCEYIIRVKEGPEINQHIFKSSPEKLIVKVNASDVEGLRLYVFRTPSKTEILAHVTIGKPDDIKSLKVRLAREDSPDQVISSVKLSEYKPSGGYALGAVVVCLGSVSADGGQYLVSLESSRGTVHDYSVRASRLMASGPVKLARLVFSPGPRPRDPDPAHPSHVALPLLLLAIGAWSYWSRLTAFFSSLLQAKSDDSSSQAFGEKRKTKLKKIM